MSKTIKVIDLLNKINNGEEVPKKIKFEEDIFEYDSSEKEYKWWQDEERFIGQTLLFAVMLGHRINEILNCEVEIIEEPEEINIQDIQEMVFNDMNANIKNESNLLINQLIKAVKYLDNKINGE